MVEASGEGLEHGEDGVETGAEGGEDGNPERLVKAESIQG
jgi:hypothetical protein